MPPTPPDPKSSRPAAPKTPRLQDPKTPRPQDSRIFGHLEAILNLLVILGPVWALLELSWAMLFFFEAYWRQFGGKFCCLLRAQICVSTHVHTERLFARAYIRARMRAEGESKGHVGKCWGQGAQRIVNNRSKSTSGAPRLDDMRPRWTAAHIV